MFAGVFLWLHLKDKWGYNYKFKWYFVCYTLY